MKASASTAGAAALPRRTLPAGTRLYHGTTAFGFEVPRGPAWFAWNPAQARKWVGWADGGLRGRVLVLETTLPMELLDTTTPERWESLADALRCEATTYEMMRAVQLAVLPGWSGRNEALLVETAGNLRFLVEEAATRWY